MSAEALANGMRGATPQAKITVVVRAWPRPTQHLRGDIDTEQASWRPPGQLVQPSACTAAGIEDVQAANIRQHRTEDPLFQRKQRVRLAVINIRPGYQTPLAGSRRVVS